MTPSPETVLVIGGGLLTEKEHSIVQALRKQVKQSRFARSAWLDAKIKLVSAEPLVGGMLERSFGSPQSRHASVKSMFTAPPGCDVPDLTEVVLTTLLEAEGLTYRTATYADLFSDRARVRRLLDEAGCVFASSTLLRDLSEVEPLMRMLKRPHNRIVLGGALAGLLCDGWKGLPEVDVLAVGYGERLVPALARWIRSGYRELSPPTSGRLKACDRGVILHGGTPQGRSLDALPVPDWKRSAAYHGVRYKLVHYESVRGCPYRCAFCNYPYLFDDKVFRYKSATKIADDWAWYVSELGVEYITCLDSLFTMPKKRLRELCRQLIDRRIHVKWTCYARADDLACEETVKLMKRAGVHQVQIGIESGDQAQLDNMNKACSVDSNARALANCRKHAVTTVVSLIVGFPGETRASLETTFKFLADNPPDFYYLATFSTRASGVPVLQPEAAAAFGLHTAASEHCMAPYWRHRTMTCREAVDHARSISRRLMRERVSLNAVLFYPGMLTFQPEHRDRLLSFQQRVVERHPLATWLFDRLNGWVDRRLDRDVERSLALPGPPLEVADAGGFVQVVSSPTRESARGLRRLSG